MAKPCNVFISWSGARSRAIAEALHEWLPAVIQTARPFMSTHIDKGSRGINEVTKALEGMRVGIVCLTPENMNEPWILYEAGALSKTIDDQTRLCTYLLGGLQFQNVRPPLGMFQHTEANKDETRKLISTVNSSISEDPVSDTNLNTIFEKMWPELEKAIKNMPSPDQVVEAKRSPDEVMAEILELSRAAANSRKQSEWLDQYIPMAKQFFPLLEQLIKGAQTRGQATQPPPQPEATAPPDLIEDVTEDGWHISRDDKRDVLLEAYYTIYNTQCFNGSLPFVAVRWAKSIILPDGQRANAVYVPGDALLKRRYIAIDDTLSGMFPLERLCLLHEMVHVKLGPESGHGKDFIAEFRRVLDANKWEVMGCIDAPPQEPAAPSPWKTR
jgi:hypothetical protein